MTMEIAPGGGNKDTVRAETSACGGATSSSVRECPATPQVAVQTLRDLIARIDREWCDESQASTPGGVEMVGEARARDQGWRAGWNASQRSLRASLVRICDEHSGAPLPIGDAEALEILERERREHEAASLHERRERERNRWAFEFDVEQDAISEAYERELGGEGG